MGKAFIACCVCMLCVHVGDPMRVFNRLSFIDKVRIYARGGRGGQGSSKVGSEGGEGGDVRVCAVEGSTLSDIARLATRRFVGGVGGAGQHINACGKKGRCVRLLVPPGTVVYSHDETDVLCDLYTSGMQTVLARGGAGGTHRTPNWHGLPGQCGVYVLQLKCIADVGLVGFPNAGKSTLLQALSNATPKIGNYPFTTVQPEIGVLLRSGESGLSIADLPGLVEGAHQNVGRGHKFLRHIERTRVLLYVVDISGFQLSNRHTFVDPYASIEALVTELELYCPGLAYNRKAILAINKMDQPGSVAALEVLLQQLQEKSPVEFHSIIACSATNNTGTQAIKQSLVHLFRN